MLEKNIEAEVGRKLGAWSRDNHFPLLYLKLSVLGMRGYPDRLIIWQDHILFVEFKRPGEQPRKLQEHVHKLLRDLGHKVMVHDNVNVAMEEITAYLGATARADSWHKTYLGRERREAVLAPGKRQDLGCAEVVSNTEEERVGGQAAGDCPFTGGDN